MKIGIFGGTFNPVHRGHLKIAQAFKDKYHLDKLLFVPNNVSPFKTDFEDIAPAKHRLKMLELSIAGEPAFEIDDFEIKLDKVSYTINTINYLSEKYSGDEILMLIGSDQAASFDKWKDYDKILQTVIVVIARRKALKGNEPPPPANILKDAPVLDNDFIDISSSEIRNKIRRGEPVYELVPFDVAEYIINNMLYL